METTYNYENDDMLCELENEMENYASKFKEEEKKYKNDYIKNLTNIGIIQIIDENINEIIDQQNKNNQSDFVECINNLIKNELFYMINISNNENINA